VSPELFLVAGIVIVGLAVRLPSFGDSLWADELSTNYVVNGFGVGNLLHIVRSSQEATPPLFFALTWLTKGFDGVEGLRVISLLAGLAAIPLTYLLGLRTVGRPAAMVGAALIALCPLQIFYATEARAYSLVMLLCVIAALAMLIAVEDGRARWWIVYGLSVAAAAYTHFTSVFALLVLFGWVMVARPEARRPALLANAGAALLFAPWIPQVLDDRHKPASKILEVIHPLSLDAAKRDVIAWFLGHPHLSEVQLPGRLAVWLIVAGLVLGLAGLIYRLASESARKWWPPPARLTLILLLAVATPVGLAIHNVFAPNLFIPRNLIPSSPALALATGALVAAGRAPLRLAAAALLIAGYSIGAVKMIDPDNRRPDFDGVADFIEQTGQPGAPVVDVGPFTPGPQTPMEAALAPKGEAGPRDRLVMTLGFPTLAARLADARAHGGGGGVFLETIPSDAEIARRAARAAGTGKIFFVVPEESFHPDLTRVPSFRGSLPPRFHEIEARRFPGLGLFPITVHVFQG
jgi:mannosyltransferase